MNGGKWVSLGRPMLALLVACAWVVAPAPAQTTPVVRQRRFSWPAFGAGVALSVAAHELAHITSALALGGSPSLAFSGARPVIRSGLEGDLHPARAFTFSAAGMGTQLVANEVILDWHHDGTPARSFERGFLAGGVVTVAFYLTVGRDASVGDVAQMERFSSLSPWTLTAIFGGVALSDALRLAIEPRYGSLFVLPLRDGHLAVGINQRL